MTYFYLFHFQTIVLIEHIILIANLFSCLNVGLLFSKYLMHVLSDCFLIFIFIRQLQFLNFFFIKHLQNMLNLPNFMLNILFEL